MLIFITVVHPIHPCVTCNHFIWLMSLFTLLTSHKMNLQVTYRVQRKSVLQPAIWASCSYQIVPAHESFNQLQNPFWLAGVGYNPSVIWISPKNSTYPSDKLRAKITSPIAKSNCPGLSDMTFSAHWTYSYNP